MLSRRLTFCIVIMYVLIEWTNGTDVKTLPKSDLQKGDDGTVGEKCPCQRVCMGGSPGIPGVNGMHGKDGSHGMPGQPGPMGMQGPSGTSGITGSRGRKGHSGADGKPGLPAIATPGEKGEKGEAGGPIRISRHSGRDNVAFSVSRRNKLGPVTANTVVTFDKIYTNLGNSFNTKSSEFEVKGEGTYIFHLHVMSQEHTDCYVWIMVNDSLKLPVYGDGRNGYGAGSGTVILQLEKNDRVWIQLNNGSAMLNDYTIFSGYLIG